MSGGSIKLTDDFYFSIKSPESGVRLGKSGLTEMLPLGFLVSLPSLDCLALCFVTFLLSCTGERTGRERMYGDFFTGRV